MNKIKKLFCGLSLPVILLIVYIAVGFISGVMSGDMDLVLWIDDHKLFLAIILTLLIDRWIRK